MEWLKQVNQMCIVVQMSIVKIQKNEQLQPAYLLYLWCFCTSVLSSKGSFWLSIQQGKRRQWNGRWQKEKNKSEKGRKKSEIAFPFLNIHISHSVHALRNMLTKLITGFGWYTEHYVEPKSEANCWAEKGPPFRRICTKARRCKILAATYRKKNFISNKLWTMEDCSIPVLL